MKIEFEGKVIPEVGIHKNISEKTYHHEWLCASRGLLDDAWKSGKHLAESIRTFHEDDTPALRLGRATHDFIEDAGAAKEKWGILPKDLNRKTSAGKEMYERTVADYGESCVLTYDQFAQVEAMRDAVMDHPIASAIIKATTDTEVSLVWDDKESGVRCKARLDLLTNKGIWADIKTTEDASPEGFSSSFAKFGYHRQALFYSMGVSALLDQPYRCAFIAVEKKPPYCVAVYEPDQQCLFAAEVEIKRRLKRWKEIWEKQDFSGYPLKTHYIGLPAWEINRINNETAGA